MSSREHHCPACRAVWHCEGCYTSEEERLCDDCLQKDRPKPGETMNEKDFKPGLYRHYKGGLYLALMLVHHHQTRELMVVYASLQYAQENGMVPHSVRPFKSPLPGDDSWTDIVTPEGKLIVTQHDRERMSTEAFEALVQRVVGAGPWVYRFTYIGQEGPCPAA